MFSTNSSKICCRFAKNKIFEKSKMASKMAAKMAMATVLNLDFMFVMESKELIQNCFYAKA